MSLMSLPELWNTFTRIQRLHCHRKLSIKKVQFFFLICVCTCVYIYIYIRKKYIYTHIHTHLMVLNYITEVIMLTKMVSTLNLKCFPSNKKHNSLSNGLLSCMIIRKNVKRKFKCWNSNSAFDRGPLHPTLPHCHLFTVHHPLECYHHLLLSLSAQGLQSSVSTCRFQPLCSCYLSGLARDAF